MQFTNRFVDRLIGPFDAARRCRCYGARLAHRGLSGLGVAAALLALCAVPATAEPVTADRVGRLPPDKQPQWKEYLDHSEQRAQADAAALRAELEANGLSIALRAPSGSDFKLSAKSGDAWFGGDEAGRLADTVLSYQTPSGGWSKHTGYSAGPRKPGMQWSSQYQPGRSPHYLGTFDNRSTTEQCRFLANVWLATGREDCKAGFVRGLQYILAAQYPNGGWPQVYPLEGDYHDDITLNDDAMTHIFEVLLGVARAEPEYAFLDDPLRQQAADALARGIACVAEMQVKQRGKRTVWCGQHDALTLRPASARAMEPATLSGTESAKLLKFLMTVPNPSPELVECIDSGLAWLEGAKISGANAKEAGDPSALDAGAEPGEACWARFYDLATGKPVFPGRDGVLYDTFAEMAAKNEVGYDYYSTIPGSIVTNGQKKWRKMLAKQSKN